MITDIHDIKPSFSGVMGYVAVLFGVIIVMLYGRYRSRIYTFLRKRPTIQSDIVVKDRFVAALQQLLIKTRQQYTSAIVHEVTQVARGYFSHQLRVNVQAMSRDEVVRLKKQYLADFIGAVYPAQYAQRVLTQQECEQLITSAMDYIRTWN